MKLFGYVTTGLLVLSTILGGAIAEARSGDDVIRAVNSVSEINGINNRLNAPCANCQITGSSTPSVPTDKQKSLADLFTKIVCDNKNPEFLDLLTDSESFDPNVRDSSGRSGLQCAIDSHRAPLLEKLYSTIRFSEGCSKDHWCLLDSIQNFPEPLLNQAVRDNKINLATATGHSGHLVLFHLSKAEIQRLRGIVPDFDINLRDPDGTPWLSAFLKGNYGDSPDAGLALIADPNVDLEAKDQSGKTALDYFFQNSYYLRPDYEDALAARLGNERFFWEYKKHGLTTMKSLVDACRQDDARTLKQLLQDTPDAQLESVDRRKSLVQCAFASGDVRLLGMTLTKLPRSEKTFGVLPDDIVLALLHLGENSRSNGPCGVTGKADSPNCAKDLQQLRTVFKYWGSKAADYDEKTPDNGYRYDAPAWVSVAKTLVERGNWTGAKYLFWGFDPAQRQWFVMSHRCVEMYSRFNPPDRQPIRSKDQHDFFVKLLADNPGLANVNLAYGFNDDHPQTFSECIRSVSGYAFDN